MMLAKQERDWIKYLVIGVVILILLIWMASRTFGQSNSEIKQNAVVTPVASLAQADNNVSGPFFTNYKGVTIGASADDVRKLLNEKPKSDEGDTLFFEFSDEEMVQIALDGEKKVRLIAVTYLGKEAHAPAYEAVFGASVPRAELPDGRIYKVIQYPNAGYWVAYSSSAPGNDDRVVAITVQKLGN